MRKGFLLVCMLQATLLGGCAAQRYAPDLSGKPTAQIYIDGRLTKSPWLSRPKLYLGVFERSSCAQEPVFAGELKGKTKVLNGPYAFPAGKRLYLNFGRVLQGYDMGRPATFGAWYSLSFVPESGGNYYLGLDTRDDDFTDVVLFQDRGGKHVRVPRQSWKEC